MIVTDVRARGACACAAVFAIAGCATSTGTDQSPLTGLMSGGATGLIAQVQDATRPTADAHLVVDGAPFAVTQCTSGSVSGFRGVDFIDDKSTKVRVLVEPNGSASVILFPHGSEVGVTMRGCAALHVADTGMAVNRIKIVQGAASMRCTSGDFEVSGTASFRCGQ